MSSPYAAWIEVNTQKLCRNLELVKKMITKKTQVMAVVKANAYGHGIQAISQVLKDKVDYFGVTNVTEAREIRRMGIETPILVMGMSWLDHRLAIKANVTLSVSSFEIAKAINDAATSLGHKAKVHIKVDTGMGRLGLSYRTAFENIQKMMSLSHLEFEGIYTHFSKADDEESCFTAKQLDLFEALLTELKKLDITFPIVHAANSSGILHQYKSEFLNMVRPGLLLYGYGPKEKLPNKIQVEPILSLKAKVLFIKEIEPGKAVSYGRSFETDKRTRIGILPIGYSHGFPYSLSKKISFLSKGERYPVAGNICMDYTMVELPIGKSVHIEDEFVFIGNSENEIISAHELAKIANTIPYEILTGLHERLPRVYVTE